MSPQEEFNRKYITTAEICRRLSINRTTVLYARRRKYLPEAIIVDGTNFCIWEREKVEPYLQAWNEVLKTRREAQKS